MALEITRIESTEFEYPIPDVGTNSKGFSLTYDPGNELRRTAFALRIHTDSGINGEYIGGNSPSFAQINLCADYLLGTDPLDRERHWNELKRALRKYDRMGLGPLDIALWDIAGKHQGEPIHRLLGTYRDRLPVYASTYPGDDSGGLDSPKAFADFSADCYDRGYRGFKIHPWPGPDVASRTVETVEAVGERVGDDIALMLDPYCELETWTEAFEVGRACDEQGFLWYEDPYSDGGFSQWGHAQLRERLSTPVMITEHVRGVESTADVLVAGRTDYLRADPEFDGGITGTMKTAHVAEGLGVDVELHGPGPAQRHCMAAMRNSNYYEMALVHPAASNTTPPVYDCGYQDEFNAIDDEGTVPVPDRPGLGVEYDWSFIERNRLGGRVYE